MGRYARACDNGRVATDMKPTAVLWDFDGTLLNTEPIWVRSETELMAEYGVDWTWEQGVEQCGTAWHVSTAAMLQEAEHQLGRRPDVDPWNLYQAMYNRVIEHLVNDGLPWLPGAEELVAELSERGVPMAVVSASPMELLDAGISQMPPGTFKTVVFGREVANGKPAPDGYLLAAERLGVDARDSIVIEDSASGTAAGRAAGAAVIGVPCMHELHEFPGQVNLPSLAGVTFDDLSRIWHELNGGLGE